jgi:hypothetical protein
MAHTTFLSMYRPLVSKFEVKIVNYGKPVGRT